MIWWFLILGVSTLVVVCVAIALYVHLRRHLQKTHALIVNRTDSPRDEPRRTLTLHLEVHLWQRRQFKLCAPRRSASRPSAGRADRGCKFVRGTVCAHHHSTDAPDSGAVDGAESRRVASRSAPRKPPRFRRSRALSGGRHSGLPVFNPTGPGGIAQLFGVTGGFLLAYPLVAFVAGYIFERGSKTFARAAIAGIAAESLLFAGGLSWLYVFTHSLAKAAYLGLYWFIAAEVIKVMLAAAIAARWRRSASRERHKIRVGEDLRRPASEASILRSRAHRAGLNQDREARSGVRIQPKEAVGRG